VCARFPSHHSALTPKDADASAASSFASGFVLYFEEFLEDLQVFIEIAGGLLFRFALDLLPIRSLFPSFPVSFSDAEGCPHPLPFRSCGGISFPELVVSKDYRVVVVVKRSGFKILK
jgi:hypothetical protein